MCSHKSWGYYGYFMVFLWILEWNHTISPPSSTIFLTSTALVPTTRPGRRGGGAKKAAASRPSKGWGKHNFSKEKRCHMMPWHDAMTCHDMPWFFESFWHIECLTTSRIHPWAYRFAHLEYLRFPPHTAKKTSPCPVQKDRKVRCSFCCWSYTRDVPHSSNWMVPLRQVRGNNLKAFHFPHRSNTFTCTFGRRVLDFLLLSMWITIPVWLSHVM